MQVRWLLLVTKNRKGFPGRTLQSTVVTESYKSWILSCVAISLPLIQVYSYIALKTTLHHCREEGFPWENLSCMHISGDIT